MRKSTSLSGRGIAILLALIGLLLLPSAPLFAAGGTCPTGNTIDPNGNPISLSSLGITSCFYVSKSTGSDTNAGTSESAPWAHLPGMSSCTNTCSSTTPTAGEGFILRGGETWVSTDLGVQWTWSGNSSNRLYVGVDQTWWNTSVCGSSNWCRPIWNAQSTMSGNMVNMNSRSWVVFDNIEMIGMRNNQNGYLCTSSTNVRITQNYFHAWSHTGSTDNVGFFSQGGAGSMADHNVIDGSDSTQNTFNGFFSSWSQIQYNYIAYVVSAVLGSTDVVHDNTVMHTVTSADGDHCNGIFTFAPANGTTQLIYNNLQDGGDNCAGGVVFWFNGNDGGNSSWIGYGFGNVIFNNSSNPLNIGNHSTANYGTYYWFNNTVDCTVGGCGGTPGNGYWTIYDNNNHFIPNALNSNTVSYGGIAPPVCNLGTGTGCTDLTQSEAVANGQGYKSNETYPYSPISSCTSSTCGTVQKGTNLQSYCTALSSINSVAGTACQYATSLSCAYNTTNHTLSCPNSPLVPRPASGAWDIGAYQAAPTECTITPTGIGPYTAGQPVSQQFSVSSCSTSTFTISSGSLSGSGLTLSSSGLLSGSAQAPSFSFTVAYSTATDPISVTVNAAPSITTSSLPAGQANSAYSQVLTTSGGTGAVACALTTGSLPVGLTLNGCTISGIPTTANSYSFTVTPTDANGVSGSAKALSILISPPNTSTPAILHTTFCGPGVSWPGTCTLSAPTTAGSRLVVVYSSYNSAGSTPVMNSITDGTDTFSQLANARSTNASSATSWNDIWSASGVAGGVTAVTVTPSTTQIGDVYVWEVQYAPNVMGCASLSSQAAATTAVGSPMLAGAGAILLSHLHPAPGGNPTAVSSPFTTDTISDQLAYAQYTPSSVGTFGPQWTQTTATFATATCGFSAAGSLPTPPSPITTVSQ
jgi:hypothetical protein